MHGPNEFEGLSCTGAILAGGRSRRMGREKYALRLADGRTMIEAVAETVRAVCRRLVILGPPGVLEGVECIQDRRNDQGPLGGIEALLDSGLDEHYLICPCDTPRLTAQFVQRLLNIVEAPATVFRFESADDFEPLPVRLAARALPQVRDALDQGRRSMTALLASLPREEIVVPAHMREALLNVNTMDDFAQANQLPPAH